MKPVCPACGSGSPDWLLCDECTDSVVEDLVLVIPTVGVPTNGELPWESLPRAWAGIEAELAISLTRQGRRAPNLGGSHASGIPLPYDQGASDQLAHLRAVLTSWVRVLDEPGDDRPADDLVSIAHWLITRRDLIRSHVACDEIQADITGVVARCMVGIDHPPRISSAPADRGHRDRLLAQALDALATRTEILAALPESYNVRVGQSRFSNWLARGRLTVRGHTKGTETAPLGYPMYRLGDVVDLARGADRTQRKPK